MEIGHTHGAAILADQRHQEATKAIEAGEKFEGYLLEMMMREMRKTVPEGLFSSSAMEMFSGMLDQHIAEAISSGGGLGISTLLQRSLPAAAEQAELRPVQALRTQRYRRKGGQMPVEGGRITSRFGKRSDPFHKKERFHRGLDIAAPQGTPIRPIKPGKVTFAGERGMLGNAVFVEHSDGTKSVYGHCHELNVQPGDRVGMNTVIGTVGSTGRSTGPHVHLAVIRDGEMVNPEPFVGL